MDDIREVLFLALCLVVIYFVNSGLLNFPLAFFILTFKHSEIDPDFVTDQIILDLWQIKLASKQHLTHNSYPTLYFKIKVLFCLDLMDQWGMTLCSCPTAPFGWLHYYFVFLISCYGLNETIYEEVNLVVMYENYILRKQLFAVASIVLCSCFIQSFSYVPCLFREFISMNTIYLSREVSAGREKLVQSNMLISLMTDFHSIVTAFFEKLVAGVAMKCKKHFCKLGECWIWSNIYFCSQSSVLIQMIL